MFSGRQVNNLGNLSVERKLYICCPLISLSGSCERQISGRWKICPYAKRYAKRLLYIYWIIIFLARLKKRKWAALKSCFDQNFNLICQFVDFFPDWSFGDEIQKLLTGAFRESTHSGEIVIMRKTWNAFILYHIIVMQKIIVIFSDKHWIVYSILFIIGYHGGWGKQGQTVQGWHGVPSSPHSLWWENNSRDELCELLIADANLLFICIFLSTQLNLKSAMHNLNQSNINIFLSGKSQSFFLSEWYRGFMSDCPDGKLNTQSFMKIYSKCFPQGNAAEFCDHVFRFSSEFSSL